jgi:hypothetical protein
VEIAWRMWEHRNHILHNNENMVNSKEIRILHRCLSRLYARAKMALSVTPDRYLVKQPLTTPQASTVILQGMDQDNRNCSRKCQSPAKSSGLVPSVYEKLSILLALYQQRQIIRRLTHSLLTCHSCQMKSKASLCRRC